MAHLMEWGHGTKLNMIKFKNPNMTITFSEKHLGEKSNLSHEQEKDLNAKTVTKVKSLGTINPTASKKMRI
jgi:hypothetical protein